MIEIFRDSIWQFIGVFFAIIAIIVSIIIYRLQQNKKYLSYQIVTQTPLLNVDKEVEQKVQILFEGKPVRNVFLLLMRFTNSGNLPILPTDYLKAISVHFNTNCKILSAEISEKEPKSIDVAAKIEDSQLTLTPTLLNNDDFFTVKILASDFDGTSDVEGRIVGVKDIHKGFPKISLGSTIIVILGLSIFVLSILLAVFLHFLYLLLGVIGILLILFPMSFDRHYKSIMRTPIVTIIAESRKQ